MDDPAALATSDDDDLRKVPPPSPSDMSARKKHCGERFDDLIGAGNRAGITSAPAQSSYRDAALGVNPSEQLQREIQATVEGIFGPDSDMADAAVAVVKDGTVEEEITFQDNGASLLMEISDKGEALLAKAWKYAVVVKVLGRDVGFYYLCEKLRTMWRLTSKVKIVDLDHGFFLVQLQSKEEYEKILLQGPWMVLGHYLMVQPWHVDFTPEEAKLSKVIAWIRIPGIPLHLFDKRVLRALGNKMGGFVRIDYNTTNKERGKFARMAVELDLSKPLKSSLEFKGKIRKIVYEDLPQVCFQCGKVGHLAVTCPDGGEPVMAMVPNPVISTPPAVHVVDGPTKDKAYGEWMIVTNRRDRRFGGAKNGPKGGSRGRNDEKSLGRSSRFDVLASEENNEVPSQPKDKAVRDDPKAVASTSHNPVLPSKEWKKKSPQVPQVDKNMAQPKGDKSALNSAKAVDGGSQISLGMEGQEVDIVPETQVAEHGQDVAAMSVEVPNKEVLQSGWPMGDLIAEGVKKMVEGREKTLITGVSVLDRSKHKVVLQSRPNGNFNVRTIGSVKDKQIHKSPRVHRGLHGSFVRPPEIKRRGLVINTAADDIAKPVPTTVTGVGCNVLQDTEKASGDLHVETVSTANDMIEGELGGTSHAT